jgi:heme-degrading monooxygenase HmoA
VGRNVGFTSTFCALLDQTYNGALNLARSIEGSRIIYQLRIYEIFQNNKAAFHDRFRDHASRIMKSYGFDIVGTWESGKGQRTEFVYLLVWPDEETMHQAWEKFRADTEWIKIKQLTNAKHGDLVGEIEDRTLIPTSYGPSLHQTRSKGH